MNRATLRSELLRHGFGDVDRAMAELAELGSAGQELVAILGRSAEPTPRCPPCCGWPMRSMTATNC